MPGVAGYAPQPRGFVPAGRPTRGVRISRPIRFSCSGQAKKDIDSFLSDVKGQSDDGGNLVFVVAGHTDTQGSASYNYELSKRRAENIAAYLVAERNIEPTRVMAVGYGERVPVADNNSDAGRAKNRRVEIMVYRESVGVGTTATGPSRPDALAAARPRR